jgi:hypothetical protein
MRSSLAASKSRAAGTPDPPWHGLTRPACVRAGLEPRMPPCRSLSTGAARDLLETRVGPAYRQVLCKALFELREFCIRHELPDPASVGNSAANANWILTKFVQAEFAAGRPPYIAKHAVLGIQKIHRHLKGKLRESWDAVESWLFERDTSLPVPLDPVALDAMCSFDRVLALQCAVERRLALAFEWFTVAGTLAVGFFAMLRPIELISIHPANVRGPTLAQNEEPWAVVAIERPKNRRSMGRIQFSSVRNLEATNWLIWLLNEVPTSGLLWPHGYRRLRPGFRTSPTPPPHRVGLHARVLEGRGHITLLLDRHRTWSPSFLGTVVVRAQRSPLHPGVLLNICAPAVAPWCSFAAELVCPSRRLHQRASGCPVARLDGLPRCFDP